MRRRFKQIEEVVVTGPADERQAAWDYLYKHGYRSTWSGPMPVGWKKYDDSRFKIIATRTIRKGKVK